MYISYDNILDVFLRIVSEPVIVWLENHSMKKLNDSKDMPKIIEITDEKSIKRYGGSHMLIAPPLEYNNLMAQ